MHELTVVSSLLNAVTEHVRAYHKKSQDKKVWINAEGENCSRVTAIIVEVGEMTCIDPSRLTFCFEQLKQRCGFGNAALKVVFKKAEMLCEGCQSLYHPDYPNQICKCGSSKRSVLSGNQLHLTEIEIS